jgi:hypothetical protein
MKRVTLLIVAGLLLTSTAFGQAVDPRIKVDQTALETRAYQEFNSGQYSVALPMLRALAEMNRNRPDILGSINEKIRVCETQIAAGLGKPTTQPSLNSTRTKHTPPKPGDVLEMSIKDLGNFDYDADKGGNIPDDVKNLAGSKVRLRGYMIPMDQAANITQFALVADLFSCCFGQPPQLQHTIIVTTPKGKSVSYYPDELVVEGTLKVSEQKDEGFIISIFQMDVTSVKPAPK